MLFTQTNDKLLKDINKAIASNGPFSSLQKIQESIEQAIFYIEQNGLAALPFIVENMNQKAIIDLMIRNAQK